MQQFSLNGVDCRALQIESKDHALMMACALKEITDRLGIGLVYKSSFDKANRSSISSKRGLLDEGLAVLDAVAKTYGCPVLTDVHLPEHCAGLPALSMCCKFSLPLPPNRFIGGGGWPGKVVNVKKASFLRLGTKLWLKKSRLLAMIKSC